MRTFIAFLKKEILESWRCGKIAIVFVLFLLFGAMNPAIAKITPWLLDVMSESLEASGMIIGEVTADVGASWTQFYKNIPMALIAFVMIFGGSFTKEYDKGTLVLVLTKGLERHKVVLAKSILMLITWTIGFWFCFGVTYAGNMIFWTNESISALVFSAFCWCLWKLRVPPGHPLGSITHSFMERGALEGTGRQRRSLNLGSAFSGYGTPGFVLHL